MMKTITVTMMESTFFQMTRSTESSLDDFTVENAKYLLRVHYIALDAAVCRHDLL